jgi:hydroxymethylbilane synthase
MAGAEHSSIARQSAVTDGDVLRVGTRGSPLARAQTSWVVTALQAAYPDLRVHLVPITTSGDRSQHTMTAVQGWGLGVFVKELEQALLRHEIDLAVHSLKDVPPNDSAALALAAIPAREAPDDVLVTSDGARLEDLPRGARVGTCSARRCAFLRAARADLEIVPLRGNVETRYRELLRGQYDAVVLARAGLKRLGLHIPHRPLEYDVLLPAPGQGALALQVRVDDARSSALVAHLHHAPTAAAVQAERKLMDDLDADCRLPVAALGLPRPGGELFLLGAVAAADGTRTVRRTAIGTQAAPSELGTRLAAELRNAGAAELLASCGTRRAQASTLPRTGVLR